jgi:hypothetical protein
MNFCPYLECSLDQAGKACQGQTLQLITNFCKIRTLKFHITGPWAQCYITISVRNL